MQPQDACVSWIVSLVEASDPSAPRKALVEADAFLSSFTDPSGTAARREILLAALQERLPRTALAEEVIKTISGGTAGA